MNNFEEFKDYFFTIALKHKQIKSVHYGDVDRILARMNNSILYPCLWLEEPDFLLKEDGCTKIVFNSNFLILDKPLSQKEEEEDTTKFNALTVALQLINRVHNSVEAGEVELQIKREVTGRFKGYFGGDLDVGCDFEMSITLPISTCDNPEDWNE